MNDAFDARLAEARGTFDAFLDAASTADRLVVFCHFDADGLAAGALFGRGLQRMGYRDVQVVHSGRGERAFSDAARQRLAALAPDALLVTDLGVNRAGVLDNVPTLYVDHHRPEGEPPGAFVVSGYAWDPIPCSAWLAYDLVSARTDAEDLLWIAAVGVLSDLGNKAPWPYLAQAKKRHTAKWLNEAVRLVNAARRASTFDVETPLRLLMEVDDPRAVSEDTARGADRLHAYRAEVQAELAEARKQAPVFSQDQPWAMIPVHSPCQIHPLIAQQWRGRLAKYAVMAANSGYLPGVVAFSSRTARPDLSLPALYRAVDLGPYNPLFGNGHDKASGGHLPPAQFVTLLRALGFAESALPLHLLEEAAHG